MTSVSERLPTNAAPLTTTAERSISCSMKPLFVLWSRTVIVYRPDLSVETGLLLKRRPSVPVVLTVAVSTPRNGTTAEPARSLEPPDGPASEDEGPGEGELVVGVGELGETVAEVVNVNTTEGLSSSRQV